MRLVINECLAYFSKLLTKIINIQHQSKIQLIRAFCAHENEVVVFFKTKMWLGKACLPLNYFPTGMYTTSTTLYIGGWEMGCNLQTGSAFCRIWLISYKRHKFIFWGPELSELLVKEVLATCQVLPYTYFSYLAMVDRYTYR